MCLCWKHARTIEPTNIGRGDRGDNINFRREN